MFEVLAILLGINLGVGAAVSLACWLFELPDPQELEFSQKGISSGDCIVSSGSLQKDG